MKVKKWMVLLGIAFLAGLTLFFYWKLLKTPYLTFSDAAKFADTARQITQREGLTTNFSFFDPKIIFEPNPTSPFINTRLPIFPLILAFFFLPFSVGDKAVITASGVVFVISSILVFLLAEKLFGKKVGLFSSIAFIFTPSMLEYASIGASESLFILEIILVVYLLLFKNKLSIFFAGAITAFMFLTRQQAPIYLFGFLVFLLLVKREMLMIFLSGVSLLVPLFLAGRINSVSLFGQQPLSLVFEHSSVAAQNVTLRGGINQFSLQDVITNLKPLAVKTFYNLYNFYKSLPTFLSPYLLTLFVLSLFKKEKDFSPAALKWAVLTILIFSFLGASLTIPFSRYVHPIIPLIIIFSVSFLFFVIEKINRNYLVAFVLILFFVAGQILGQIFLDSRFLARAVNKDKPTINFILGKMVGQETRPEDLVVTNVDTWGSWYGERKTVWLPFRPNQLIPPEGEKTKIDVIFLTSYLADDPAQALGFEWSDVLNNPGNPQNEFIKENFYLAKEFKIESEENYNRESVYGVILKRR